MAPDGHSMRRQDGSYTGRFHGGETARMPDSPSTSFRPEPAIGRGAGLSQIHARVFGSNGNTP